MSILLVTPSRKTNYLTIGTGNCSISKGTTLILDMNRADTPAPCLIDGFYYLCYYAGPGDDGFVGIPELAEAILP